MASVGKMNRKAIGKARHNKFPVLVTILLVIFVNDLIINLKTVSLDAKVVRFLTILKRIVGFKIRRKL